MSFGAQASLSNHEAEELCLKSFDATNQNLNMTNSRSRQETNILFQRTSQKNSMGGPGKRGISPESPNSDLRLSLEIN